MNKKLSIRNLSRKKSSSNKLIIKKIGGKQHNKSNSLNSKKVTFGNDIVPRTSNFKSLRRKISAKFVKKRKINIGEDMINKNFNKNIPNKDSSYLQKPKNLQQALKHRHKSTFPNKFVKYQNNNYKKFSKTKLEEKACKNKKRIPNQTKKTKIKSSKCFFRKRDTPKKLVKPVLEIKDNKNVKIRTNMNHFNKLVNDESNLDINYKKKKLSNIGIAKSKNIPTKLVNDLYFLLHQ